MSLGERAGGVDSVGVEKIVPSRPLRLLENAVEHAMWRLEKFGTREEVDRGEPYEMLDFEGNVLLNEGINDVLATLLCGGAATVYDNSNARLGVGDGSTGEQATDTGLLGTNKLWKGMMATYPTYGASQQTVFKSEFSESEAQWAWEEYTLVNAADDTGDNLVRKTQSLGTKGAEIWRLTLTVTWS